MAERDHGGMRSLAVLLGVGSMLGLVAWFWWTCMGQNEIRFLPQHGSAQWIMYPSAAEVRIHGRQEWATVFRRSFVLETSPGAATLHVAGFHRYSLQVNGSAPGAPASPAPHWKQPDRFELTQQLRAGTNEITVMVFNSNGPPALWLALTAPNLKLMSDESWECSYAEAAWHHARSASLPKPVPAGSLLSGGEQPWAGLRKRWPTLLSFAGLSALVYLLAVGPGRRLVGGAAAPPTFGEHSRGAAIPAVRKLASGDGLLLLGLAGLWVTLFANNLGALPVQVGYDVGAHRSYINYLQTHHALPLANEGWEMFQPPLYYLLCALVLDILGMSVMEPDAIGVVRLLGLGIGVAHFVIIWASLRLLFPGERAKALWGLLLAAFLPPLIYLCLYVTNESLAATLVSGCVYLTLRLLRQPRARWRAYAGLGLCLGAAMLTKSSALLAVPTVLAGLLWRTVTFSRSNPARSGEEPASTGRSLWRERVGGPVLMLVICALVSGWHYVRTWLHFGTPLLGVWDPRTGFGWWQDDGYRTSAYYGRFGEVLVYPWFSGFRSFADGLYSTLWGDGLYGGLTGGLDRPPWNYDLMAVGYWLALPLTAAAVVGGLIAVVRWVRQPRAEWLTVLGLLLLAAAALVQFSLAEPYHGNVKAFYGMAALIPFCALAALGLEAIVSWNPRLRVLCWVLLGTWGLNAYASFWIVRSTAPATILRAKSLVDEGRQPEAVQELRQLLERTPRNLDARAFLISLLSAGGLDPQAFQEAEELARDNPEHAGVQLALARWQARQGQLELATVHARRAVELAPGDLDAYRCLTMLLVRQGAYTEAGQLAREGLGLSAASAELRFALGLALLKAEPTNAAVQLELAFQLEPHLPGAHALLGSALASLGRLEDAAAQYSEALNSDIGNPGLHCELGMVLAMAGKLEEATNHLFEAVHLQPEDFQAHFQLAMILERQQQTAATVEHYAEALRLKPEFPEALNNLAWIRATHAQAEFRQGAEAVRLAERACQLTEYKEAMFLGTLAAAYAEAGRFAEAAAAADKAQRLALTAGQKELAEKNQRLHELFLQRRPYREPDGRTQESIR